MFSQTHVRTYWCVHSPTTTLTPPLAQYLDNRSSVFCHGHNRCLHKTDAALFTHNNKKTRATRPTLRTTNFARGLCIAKTPSSFGAPHPPIRTKNIFICVSPEARAGRTVRLDPHDGVVPGGQRRGVRDHVRVVVIRHVLHGAPHHQRAPRAAGHEDEEERRAAHRVAFTASRAEGVAPATDQVKCRAELGCIHRCDRKVGQFPLKIYNFFLHLRILEMSRQEKNNAHAPKKRKLLRNKRSFCTNLMQNARLFMLPCFILSWPVLTRKRLSRNAQIFSTSSTYASSLRFTSSQHSNSA